MSKMDRRDFLVGAAKVGAAIGLSGITGMATADSNESKSEGAPQRWSRHWAWTSIDTKAAAQSLKEKYRQLKSHGLTGVYLEGGIDDREFDIIKAAGLEIHSWMWTVNRGDQWIRDHHPDWYQVSRSGKSCFDNPPYVNYYRWVSPIIPGVQNYLADEVAKLASHPAVSGVHLDYVRYPDIILPPALWKQYNLDETEELPDYDFCYSDHTRAAFKKASGRDPLEIKDPAHDQEWLHFRYDSVTHLVQRLAKVAHGHGKKITAAVFPTPNLARKICRQDWDKWPLDWANPMIYHSFYNQDVDWIGECMLENIRAARFPIFSGLYMPAFTSPGDFRKGLQIARKRGAAGVSLFGGVGDDYWKVFEEEAAIPPQPTAIP